MRRRKDRGAVVSRSVQSEVRAAAQCTTELASAVMQNEFRRERIKQWKWQAKAVEVNSKRRAVQVPEVDRGSNA
jgi:hypothetical protein